MYNQPPNPYLNTKPGVYSGYPGVSGTPNQYGTTSPIPSYTAGQYQTTAPSYTPSYTVTNPLYPSAVGGSSLSNIPPTNTYSNQLQPPAANKNQIAGAQISNTQIEDDEQNFQGIVEKREREAQKKVWEGECYDPLKPLSEAQIAEYSKRGIEDYLNCLRLSTKSEMFTKYDRTLKTCEVSGVKDFKDTEFPPELNSLVGTNQAGRTSWKGLKWLRPRDIQNYSSFELYKGDIEPNDIRQGYLGDCYFLSSIASLAEWPERIKSIFTFDKPNPYGCHCIRICDKGEWREVIVDEFFPCVSTARGPAFTKGNEAEIWVMLLEKAWAKINGSYDQIEAGLTRECLHDFTGAPTQTLWLDEAKTYDTVWQKLLVAEKNNYAMTCGSTDFEQKEILDKVGIISGHAYSLLGAYEVNHQGRQVKLVKLRNPWGEREWNGNWCDGDSKFNQLSTQDLNKLDILERARNGVSDDGIFFMEYDDFRQYFTDAQVCYIHDDFQYTSIRASSKATQGKFFKMRITERGRYFITINQKSKRKYPKDFQKEFKYSSATLLIAKQESDGTFKYIEGQQKEDREVWAGENDNQIYEPGTYIVYTKVQWRYKETDEYVLSSYGIGKPTFTEITKVESQNVIKESYFDHAANVSKRQKKLLQDGKAWIVLDQTDDGYFYLAIQNKSNKVLNGEFKFTKMGGLKLKKPFSGQTVQVSLQPGQHECALLRVKDYKALTGLSLSQTVHFK